MSHQRVERDRFGECVLPADSLYGIQTRRAIENLSFSGKKLYHYPELVCSFAMVKKACARANSEAGELDEELANAIVDACHELIAGLYLEQFPVDALHGGGSIAFNMNVNEVLSNLANRRLGRDVGKYDPVQPKRDVNRSQSTADVSATAFRLAMRRLFVRLRDELAGLSEEMANKARELSPVVTMARTCMQDAMPASISTLLGGYETALMRRTQALDNAISNLSQVNLGGTVIGTGSGASERYRNIVVDILSEVTGLPCTPRENLCDAAQNVDDLAEVSSAVEHMAQLLIKICKDLRLLTSGPKAGFNELTLPRVQEGSSFFTEKNNPVVPETVINCCLQLLGLNRTVQSVLEHAELNLNVFESVAAVNILDELRMLTEAVSLFRRKCLFGLDANRQRCKSYIEEHLAE